MSFVKKPLTGVLIAMLPFMAMSQVGIGTSSPNASAKLDISASDKGLLPPRVALTGTAVTGNAIASPATGLLVYNTATAGTSPANVTPGFYYYDGSKWQRIINQQPDATVDFDKLTPTTSNVSFSPNTPASTDYVYVSTVDGSQWTYNGSTYVSYTPTPSSAWYLKGGTTDAGSNKAGSIYRTGPVGIGDSTVPSALLAVTASNKGFLPPRVALTRTTDTTTIPKPIAAGLLVYNTATAGSGSLSVQPGYYYHNGSLWVKLGEEKATNISGVTTIGPNGNIATLGNLRIKFLSGEVLAASVSGTFNICGSVMSVYQGIGGAYIDCNSPKVLTSTAFTSLITGYVLAGNSIVWYLYDNANGISWRVTVIVGAQFAKNTIVIERLAQE